MESQNGLNNVLTELIAVIETGESEAKIVEKLQDIFKRDMELRGYSDNPNLFSGWLSEAILFYFTDIFGAPKVTFGWNDGTRKVGVFMGKLGPNNYPVFLIEEKEVELGVEVFSKRAFTQKDETLTLEKWEKPEIKPLIDKLSRVLVKHFSDHKQIDFYQNNDDLEADFLLEAELPLDKIVGFLQKKHHKATFAILDSMKVEVGLLKQTLKRALNAFEQYLDENKAEQPNLEAALDYLQKQNVFEGISVKSTLNLAKSVIRRKIKEYLRICKLIKGYREKYENEPWKLLKLLDDDLEEAEIIGKVQCVWRNEVVVLTLEPVLFQKAKLSGESELKGGALVMPGKGLIFFKAGFPFGQEALLKHELRHMRNHFLMTHWRLNELVRLKDEIIAYFEDGTPVQHIIMMLTAPKYIYDYFPKRNHPDFKLDEWLIHCRRVFKGIQAAYLNKERDLDDLAMTPIAQWRGHHGKRPAGNIFFITKNADEDEKDVTLQKEIRAVCESPENASVFDSAGLYGMEPVYDLLRSKFSGKISDLTCTVDQSGILVFDVDGKFELAICPTLSAINTFVKTRQTT